jgi:hypothetical protein
MKIEKMTKAVIVLSTIFFVSITSSTALAKNGAEKIIISKTRQLYQELMAFKNDNEFHRVGFGRCCKYYNWMQKVEKLREDPNAKLLLQKGVVVGDLLMLGLEYAKNGGRETDYTKYMNQQFKEALNLK